MIHNSDLLKQITKYQNGLNIGNRRILFKSNIDVILSSSTTKMNWAAKKGHSYIMKWSYCNITGRHISSIPLINAAWQGHYHILQWLYDNVYGEDCGYCPFVIKDRAKRKGFLNVAAWLDAHYPNLP